MPPRKPRPTPTINSIEAIIAHEYFHNWTGNRITCRDWFQLCLKEGLTVFRDQEFTSDIRSRPVKRIADVRALRGHQFVEDAGPLAHAVRPEVYREINNFYTSTIYEKGAEVVRMLKTLLGPDKFRAGMDLYFARHDGHAATVDEFIAVLRRCRGLRPRRSSCAGIARPARPRSWCRRTTTLPPGPARWRSRRCAADAGAAGQGAHGHPAGDRLSRARRPRPAGHARKRRAARARRHHAHQAEGDLRVRRLDARPVMSLNRGFSAPVKLTANLATAISPSSPRMTAIPSTAGRRCRRWRPAS